MEPSRRAHGPASSNGRNAIEAVFFDIRDTLGIVDRKGHLVTYKPTTDQLLAAMRDLVGLRIGLITNLPANVSPAEGRKMVEEAGLGKYLDPDGFISNHDADADKPDARIYVAAAARMKVPVERCLFVGENLIEVVGAQKAGMKAMLKPFPPGREFLLKPVERGAPTPTDSGRLSERLMEEDHLIAKRIVVCGMKIREVLESGAGAASAPARAMGLLVWLTRHFVDAFHHRKEEEVLIPFAIMRGLAPSECAFVALEHEQGRGYFAALDVALRRFQAGDARALKDFSLALQGFAELYREHGRKEDDVLFKKIGETQSDTDDALVIDLMQRIGPADLTLYLALIAEMELELGIS